jgi:hypothetical protein
MTGIQVCRWISFESPKNFRRNHRWHFVSCFPRVNQHIGPIHCIATNNKYAKWSKQWSIELFLTAFRFRDAHPIVGHPSISSGR